MSGPVGGDPDSISAGGARLVTTARNVATRATGINQAGTSGLGASGGSPVGAALARFVAGYSQFVSDLSTELNALGTLANNGAIDLNTAGGGAGGRRPEAH